MLVVLTIFFAYLCSSLVEYILHRFAMHSSSKQRHIQNHHKKFNGKTNYAWKNPVFYDIVSSNKYLFFNVILYLPIAIIIFLNSKTLGMVFLLISLLYTLYVEYVHYYYHKEEKIFLDNFAFYRYTKEHHRIHHYIYDTNYGIASSIWDIIFRTKRYNP